LLAFLLILLRAKNRVLFDESIMNYKMLKSKRLFIFDMDGVLYRTDDPIPTAHDAVKKLRALGKRVVFQTNNATKTPEEFATKLTRMGLPTDADDIFTSSVIAARNLGVKYPDGTAYIIGENGIITAMKNAGFTILNQIKPEIEFVNRLPPDLKADVVIVGLDSKVTYHKLRTGMMLINAGAHFYATNDDSNFPASGTLWPGAGALVAFLSTALGFPPREIFGKPHAAGLQGILTQFNISPADAVVIGDRLNTDILGGKRTGITTVLVETGINTRKDIPPDNPELHPDYLYADLSEMIHEHF
jgi:4-nitrophenyl phosphatase